MAALQSHTTSGANTIAMVAATEAFGNDAVQAEVEAMTAAFRRRRDLLVTQFRTELPGTEFVEPMGAFYLFFRVDEVFTRHIPTATEFCRRLITDEGLALVPGARLRRRPLGAAELRRQRRRAGGRDGPADQAFPSPAPGSGALPAGAAGALGPHRAFPLRGGHAAAMLSAMGLAAKVVERKGKPPRINYKWDAETDILTGAVKGGAKDEGDAGLTGSVELEGVDGSFVLLDVAGGSIRGVEVVVWPDVRTVATLAPPTEVADADVHLPNRRSQPSIAAIEVDTPLTIETNGAETVFRVRVGVSRKVEVVRVAEGLLIELDEQHELAGLWLVGVPPFPSEEPAL